MENNVNKPAESKSNRPSLIAVAYGKNKGNSGGTSAEYSYIFDSEYFSAGSTGVKRLVCLKDCTVTIKALVANPDGSYTMVKKNSTAWGTDGTKIIGGSRVYTTPFTDEATVSLVAGDWLGFIYQGVTDKTDAGGCYLIYLPIE